VGLVALAPATPVPGPDLPLPATRLPAHLSAVAVLGRVSWILSPVGCRSRCCDYPS
jgi:hypothetical protein